MPSALALVPPAAATTVPSALAAPPDGGSRTPRRAFRAFRALRPWLLPLGGVAILAVLLWRLGTGPVLTGLRTIDGRALAAALGIGALTTVCCAWRWRMVAGGLGVELPLRTAVAACYRSAFLNSTLPGGVLGDVHRAVSHGRDAGDVGRGIRAVMWERTAGQVVQIVMAMVLLCALPSPVQGILQAATAVIAAVVAGLAGAALLSRSLRPGGSLLARFAGTRLARALRTAADDIRGGLIAGGKGPRIVLASAAAVAGYLALFLIAARTAGSSAPLSRLLPLTLLALLAAALPANLGGFGPREGVAAWAFGASGLAATEGVATAVVFGTLVIVSTLPGAAVLILQRIRRPLPPQRRVPPVIEPPAELCLAS